MSMAEIKAKDKGKASGAVCTAQTVGPTVPRCWQLAQAAFGAAGLKGTVQNLNLAYRAMRSISVNSRSKQKSPRSGHLALSTFL